MLPDSGESGMKEVVVKKDGNTTYYRRVRFASETAEGAVAAVKIKEEAPETVEVPEIVSAEADPGEVVATDTGACGAPQQMTSQLTSPVSETETARSTQMWTPRWLEEPCLNTPGTDVEVEATVNPPVKLSEQEYRKGRKLFFSNIPHWPAYLEQEEEPMVMIPEDALNDFDIPVGERYYNPVARRRCCGGAGHLLRNRGFRCGCYSRHYYS